MYLLELKHGALDVSRISLVVRPTKGSDGWGITVHTRDQPQPLRLKYGNKHQLAKDEYDEIVRAMNAFQLALMRGSYESNLP